MSRFQSFRCSSLNWTSLLTIWAFVLSFGFAQAAPKKASPRKPAAAKPRVKSGFLPPLQPAAVVPAPPAPLASDLLLYDGQAPDQSKLTLSSWGGGSVSDNAELSFSKGHSLKITTLDPYQGAMIALRTPVDLGSLADPERVMIFMLRLTSDTRNLRTGSDTFIPNRPRLLLAQFPQGTQPPNYPPQGRPPFDQNGPGFNSAPPSAALPPQTLSSVHLIFTRADGSKADVLRPYPDLSQTDAGAGAEQWVPVSVPLAALHFASGAANSPLQSIILAGNDYAVLYLGQIRVTRDTAPIRCFAGDSQTVPAGQPIVLRGTADGGASSLKYSWDFNSADGITEEASGPSVTTSYTQPKDYTVTLTVSDIDGLKKPATSTVVIHVQ